MVSRACEQMSNLLRDQFDDPAMILIERVSLSGVESHDASEVSAEYQRRANAAPKADGLRSCRVSKI